VGDGGGLDVIVVAMGVSRARCINTAEEKPLTGQVKIEQRYCTSESRDSQCKEGFRRQWDTILRMSSTTRSLHGC
jgi:hypothetical protein